MASPCHTLSSRKASLLGVVWYVSPGCLFASRCWDSDSTCNSSLYCESSDEVIDSPYIWRPWDSLSIGIIFLQSDVSYERAFRLLHTVDTSIASLPYEVWCVYLNLPSLRNRRGILGICRASHLCGSSYVSSGDYFGQSGRHILDTGRASHQCVVSYVSPKLLFAWSPCDSDNTCNSSHHCGPRDVLTTSP